MPAWLSFHSLPQRSRYSHGIEVDIEYPAECHSTSGVRMLFVPLEILLCSGGACSNELPGMTYRTDPWAANSSPCCPIPQIFKSMTTSKMNVDRAQSTVIFCLVTTTKIHLPAWLALPHANQFYLFTPGAGVKTVHLSFLIKIHDSASSSKIGFSCGAPWCKLVVLSRAWFYQVLWFCSLSRREKSTHFWMT